jgi:hypothetical protein
MAKPRPAASADQMKLAFGGFEAPSPARHDAALAGLERTIAAGVARALKEDPRSRAEVAGAVSSLMDEDVSRWMLDAYASEARDTHSISAGRFLALMAATERFDILDAILTRVGARVLVGDEVHTARLGHLEARMRELQSEIAAVKRVAKPMRRRGHG